ncbi:hypothetical protein AAE478_002184 [Parahypoxylon ruwenzoriense]
MSIPISQNSATPSNVLGRSTKKVAENDIALSYNFTVPGGVIGPFSYAFIPSSLLIRDDLSEDKADGGLLSVEFLCFGQFVFSLGGVAQRLGVAQRNILDQLRAIKYIKMANTTVETALTTIAITRVFTKSLMSTEI